MITTYVQYRSRKPAMIWPNRQTEEEEDKQDGEQVQGRKTRHHRPAKSEEVVAGREKEIC